MRQTHHKTKKVIEDNPITGDTVKVKARLPKETERLRDLAETLPGMRTFVVTRNVIVSHISQSPMRFEVQTMHILAANIADALAVANDTKFNREVALGHHKGKAASRW